MSQQIEQHNLNLPRFCNTRELAEVFGYSHHWIYKLRKRGKAPPHLKGIRPHRYDTKSKAFRDWLTDLGVDVDSQANGNV
jgi:hypothetical protein